MFSTSTAPMSRWRAAGIHLSICLVIAALVGSLIYFVWYPPPYFSVAGGSNLMLLIMCVDVVLGPSLTLAVFQSGKKGLKFDLTVIAALQIAAFCYGICVIALARPVFIVAAVDRFIPIAAKDLDGNDLAQATLPEFSEASWTGPRLVAAVFPADIVEKDRILSSALKGRDIEKLPKYYVPYAQAENDLIARAKPLKTLLAKHPDRSEAISRFVEAHGHGIEELSFLPLMGREDDYSMVISAQTKQPVGALAIDPW